MEFRNFKDIAALAEKEGFHVTSTNGGSHNVGSKHYRGLAIDVRTRDKTSFQVEQFIKLCREKGLIVRDERRKPAGQKVWSGPHLHIEISGVKVAPVLKFGDRGDAVRVLQRALLNYGHLDLATDADGIFGNETRQAVIAYQIEKKLTADGIVGGRTRKLLGI